MDTPLKVCQYCSQCFQQTLCAFANNISWWFILFGADGSEKVISVQPKLDPKQPSVLKGKEEDSGVTEDSEDEDEDSDDSDSDSDQGEYFDLAHPTRFWNRVEAGMRTRT
jgi:hypothetical protein